MKWDGWRIVYGVLVCLFGLLVLIVIGPDLTQLFYVGHPGERTASCQSNMKQLGLALTQYEQDSDGIQPPVTSTGNGWREAIYPYTKSTGVYECPDDVYNSDFSLTNLPRSYAANHLGPDSHGLERGAFSGSGEPLANLYHLEYPSSTIVLADARGDQAEEWDMVSPVFLPQPNGSRELHGHVPRHLFLERPTGTLNVLMGDGHVKALPPMNTLTPVNLWTHDNAPFAGQGLSNARAILQHAQDE